MVINETFEYPDDNPFKNDRLSREPIADNLEKIIASTNGSLVLSIDAGWGNGKTTFINMWRKKLDQTDRYNTLYFNAWENDDCDDPLLALICEIEDAVIKDQISTFEKIRKYGQPLLKKALPTMLKMATGISLDLADVSLSESNEKILQEFSGKLGEFEQYKEQKMSKAKFKKVLKEYQEKEGKKIIFFIDELDRCRPTFAIETLEKIKHLFNIDSYVFILDKKQLMHSIKTLYGQDMDSAGYLRRFIDIEFILPEPNRATYTDFLLKKYNLKNNNTKYFEKYLKAAIESYNLSLRDIEKLFYMLGLIIPTTPLFDENAHVDIYWEVMGLIYAVFPVLKVKNNLLYEKFVKREPVDDRSILKNITIDERINHYSSIMSSILTINNRLKQTDRNTHYEEYLVGDNNDYSDDRYNISYLLDESTRSEFSFIKQIEFADNFVLFE